MGNWSKEEAIARLQALKEEQERLQKEMQEMMESEVNSCRENYNIPVYFKGDIIITDPCYLMNKKNDDRFDEKGQFKSPSWWDYVSKTTTTECDDGKGGTYTRYNMPKPEDYPDCRLKVKEDYEDEVSFILGKDRSHPSMFSPTLEAEWKAYYKAQEEWSSVPHSDWERCGCGEDMSVLGLKTFIVGDTLYGDWSCTAFNSDTEEKIGEFCADAGMVGVFLLDEVLAYNPDFNYHIERPWTTTLIKDFDGTVELKLKRKKKNRKYEGLNDYDDSVQVVGKGNINFLAGQTGV